MEDRHGSEQDQLLEQVRVSEEAVGEERRAHTNTQAELNRTSQELEENREEFVRERAILAAQLKDKETELESLRAKVSYLTLCLNFPKIISRWS